MAPEAFQRVLPAAHMSPRRSNDKSDFHVSLSEVAFTHAPHHERQSSTQTTGSLANPKRDWLLQQYHKARRWGKIVSILTNVVSAILTIVIESIMIYVLFKFYTTKGLYMEGRPWGPWAKESIIWPTFMFAAASAVTALLALATLIALYNRSKRKAVYFSLAFVVVHVVAWVVVAVVYRTEKTEKDLWGWSCTEKAKAIQQELGKGKIDFDSLCQLQSSSWEISIVHIGIKVVTSAVSWFFDREQSGLKTELSGDVGSTILNQLT